MQSLLSGDADIPPLYPFSNFLKTLYEVFVGGGGGGWNEEHWLPSITATKRGVYFGSGFAWNIQLRLM